MMIIMIIIVMNLSEAQAALLLDAARRGFDRMCE